MTYPEISFPASARFHVGRVFIRCRRAQLLCGAPRHSPWAQPPSEWSPERSPRARADKPSAERTDAFARRLLTVTVNCERGFAYFISPV